MAAPLIATPDAEWGYRSARTSEPGLQCAGEQGRPPGTPGNVWGGSCKGAGRVAGEQVSRAGDTGVVRDDGTEYTR